MNFDFDISRFDFLLSEQSTLMCPVAYSLAVDWHLNKKKVSFCWLKLNCTTFHRYPIFSTRYSVMCKVYTGYCGTSEI